MPPQRSTPGSTYRLQFNKDFRLADATRLLDYFSELGITDVYASPILVSRTGSGHGYDVTDPTRIDPEIGTPEEFEAFQDALVERGMGLLLDIVPNHMAASSENRWWMDVLEYGPDSAFASYFDIDWHPSSRSLDGKVLLPILGRPFGEALDAGEIQLVFEADRFFVRYFQSIFPIKPSSYYQVLSVAAPTVEGHVEKDTAGLQEFSGILAGFLSLARNELGASAAETRVKFEEVRERLRVLVTQGAGDVPIIEAILRQFNGTPGDSGSFVLLDKLLGEQRYLLAYWREPNEGINYRRFFAISDLVGMRVEDPLVFDATHSEILRLVAKGAARGLRSGLRVDHIDGLRDPSGYLNRVQPTIRDENSTISAPGYVVVEKILARDEKLPRDWRVCGTTGYDFLNYLNGPFVQPQGARKLQSAYADFTKRKKTADEIIYEKKKLVMNSILGVEIHSLARQLCELAASDRYARSVPRHELFDALIEVTACMPVYRTYIRTLDVPCAARTVIDKALSCASGQLDLSRPCLDFMRDVLTLANPPHVQAQQLEERLTFVMRWQQFTGPIVGKGLEDSALYVYYPLSSLNEVGGDPDVSRAVSRQKFLDFISDRQREWPHALSATTTHDTKRSEDVRARINVLSEIPELWTSKIATWSDWNAKDKNLVNGMCAPDANEEYLIYQTLVGIWPAELSELATVRSRMQEYMVKALREATIHTRWAKPNEAHESAVVQFIDSILSSDPANRFLPDMNEFQRRIAWCGMINGLAQMLLKITAPGTPDFYQGSELWDFRLVDPDNRRPVDFEARQKTLAALRAGSVATSELLHDWHNGWIKLYVAWKALHCRREHEAVFDGGDLSAPTLRGARADNLISVLRSSATGQALTLVPRWLAEAYEAHQNLPTASFWQDTEVELPSSASMSWFNVFTGEHLEAHHGAGAPCIAVKDALRSFPVALFVAG
jgi:(1->4)-alpha-D-glucan 1-alpha-D-glucosylmutase